MILCDIGNTTFSFFDTKTKKSFKYKIDEFNKIKLDNSTKIYFISVNQRASKKLLKRFPNSINLEHKLDFHTNYSGMGIDRKVLCSYKQNAILIDAGSAITVDIMQSNTHLGGTIMLGLDAIKKAYPNISNRLQVDFKPFIKDNLPQNTNEAINCAITDMIIEPIKKIINLYPHLKVYITGGDGKMIYKILKVEFVNFTNIRYNPNLIFKAMKKIR